MLILGMATLVNTVRAFSCTMAVEKIAGTVGRHPNNCSPDTLIPHILSWAPSKPLPLNQKNTTPNNTLKGQPYLYSHYVL